MSLSRNWIMIPAKKRCWMPKGRKPSEKNDWFVKGVAGIILGRFPPLGEPSATIIRFKIHKTRQITTHVSITAGL